RIDAHFHAASDDPVADSGGPITMRSLSDITAERIWDSGFGIRIDSSSSDLATASPARSRSLATRDVGHEIGGFGCEILRAETGVDADRLRDHRSSLHAAVIADPAHREADAGHVLPFFEPHLRRNGTTGIRQRHARR